MGKKRIHTGTVFFVLLLVFMKFNVNAQGKPTGTSTGKLLRAGAATSNITPMLGTPIVGNFTEPPAKNVHDELHVRCLALDDGTTQLALITIDNVGADQQVLDEAKRLIHKATGWPVEHLLISSVHTHSAVNANGRLSFIKDDSLDEYQTFLAKRISDAAQMARNRLEPARIGWGVGNVPQHLFNRRWKMKEPVMDPFGRLEYVETNPDSRNPNIVEPAGPTDPQVSFISVKSTSGRPIALFANYSLHYVGGVPVGDISADYFAVFADRIRHLLKADGQDPPFIGLISNGTSGDVNNKNLRTVNQQYKPYEKMKIVADDLANEVVRLYPKVHYVNSVRLQAVQTELALKVRRPSQEMLANIHRVMERPDTSKPLYNEYEKVYAKRVMTMQNEWPDSVNVILQAFRIGDLGIAAIPFEVFTETGLEIKNKSPFKPTFTIELANGRYGYLPTPEQHKLGGYETWLGTNTVETDASRKVVATLLTLFSKLN